jgi:hypothetical protein
LLAVPVADLPNACSARDTEFPDRRTGQIIWSTVVQLYNDLGFRKSASQTRGRNNAVAPSHHQSLQFDLEVAIANRPGLTI